MGLRIFLISTLVGFAAWGSDFTLQIIGGAVVPTEGWEEVLSIHSSAGMCGGVVVGPKAILLAAHCVPPDSPTLEFEYQGKMRRALGVKSPLFNSKGHDLAIAVPYQELTGSRHATIGGTPELETEVMLAGYGCLKPEEPAIPEGISVGRAKVINRGPIEWISQGSALCFGDLGGPALVADGPSRRKVVGVGIRSNFREISYWIRLDTPESREFFKRTADSFDLVLCGFNGDCY